MLIHRVLNNNVAVILDNQNREKIIMGCGICFKRKSGDKIDTTLVEKEFILADDAVRRRFKQVAIEVATPCLTIAEHIIQKAISQLGTGLNENIYVALTDHIQFTVNRYHQGLQLRNGLIWHVKRMYPEEYQIGAEAAAMIEQSFGVTLLEDESAFIAMHIVAAETNEEIKSVVDQTNIIQHILTIIIYHFGIALYEESIQYHRFLIHLKFFVQRITSSALYEGGEDEVTDGLFESVKTSYPEAFTCSMKIGKYIKHKLDKSTTNEEIMYLTIHIQKLITDIRKGNKENGKF